LKFGSENQLNAHNFSVDVIGPKQKHTRFF